MERPLRARLTAGVAAALCGTFMGCSPPDLPADTAAKRVVDRLLPRAGWPACAYFMAVAALWTLASHLASRPSLVVAGMASLAGGTWCGLNFWRCRHAHCAVTGAGWLALAGFTGAEAILGHSVIGGFESIVFLGTLGGGVVFEAGWNVARGGPAVTSRCGTTWGRRELLGERTGLLVLPARRASTATARTRSAR